MSARGFPITKIMQERRRKEAEARQAEYNKLSTQDKLDRLPPAPFAKKERAKLTDRLLGKQVSKKPTEQLESGGE